MYGTIQATKTLLFHLLSRTPVSIFARFEMKKPDARNLNLSKSQTQELLGHSFWIFGMQRVPFQEFF